MARPKYDLTRIAPELFDTATAAVDEFDRLMLLSARRCADEDLTAGTHPVGGVIAAGGRNCWINPTKSRTWVVANCSNVPTGLDGTIALGGPATVSSPTNRSPPIHHQQNGCKATRVVPP